MSSIVILHAHAPKKKCQSSRIGCAERRTRLFSLFFVSRGTDDVVNSGQSAAQNVSALLRSAVCEICSDIIDEIRRIDSELAFGVCGLGFRI